MNDLINKIIQSGILLCVVALIILVFIGISEFNSCSTMTSKEIHRVEYIDIAPTFEQCADLFIQGDSQIERVRALQKIGLVE